jgi:hypothetical protein
MRNLFAFFAVCLLAITPAMASTVVQKYVPHAEQVGSGKISYAFWDIYDATLYAPKGIWHAHTPYALSIHYFREIKGNAIAERSVEEMRKQGFSDEVKLAQWHIQMRRIFPDVKNGTVLTAIFTAHQSTDFYLGNRHIGSIKGAEFAKHFSNIWLSEKTSEPELRQKLLGFQ